MKTVLNLPEELITSIDVTNTLNGGTSEPIVKLEKFPAYHQIVFRIPGIDGENIKIEINNNQLMIYYFTPMMSLGKELKFPKVVYNKSIHYFVDVENISVSQEGKSMVVRLPFNELADGYHRDLTVPEP